MAAKCALHYFAGQPFFEETKMKKLKYCVYVLHSLKDNKQYIGYTTNLKRRLTEHFGGRNISTKNRRPFILLFCEYYLSENDAKRREKYFKTTIGKRVLRLMLKNSFEELEK